MISGPAGYTHEDDCQAVEYGDFIGMLRRTGKAGTDGSLEDGTEPTNRRVGAGAAALDNGQASILVSRVVGEQTVPRAELTALLHVLNRIDDTRVYTIFIDAKYVVDGVFREAAHLAIGDNGDLWVRIYHRLQQMRPHVSFVKVKSHVIDQETYEHYQMTDEMPVYFEAADKAASLAIERLCRNDKQSTDELQFGIACSIAHRLSAIECQIWSLRDDTDEIPIVPSDRKAQLESHTKELKRKLSVAIGNTSGGTGHSIHKTGLYWKCADCPCYSKANPQSNSRTRSYWMRNPCNRARKYARPTIEKPVDRMVRQYKEFMHHNSVEHFDIGADSEAEANYDRSRHATHAQRQ